jgi:predicted phosphoribosyltransferase
MEKYFDRYEAGKVLAEHLKSYRDNPEAIVLALPRGGVPVAFEIAQALSLPLDIFLVRKLGVPTHKELAMGAIASGNIVVFNESILQQLQIPTHLIDNTIHLEQQELKRREQYYRGNRPALNLTGKIIILVDDGIATGATMRAAIKAIQLQNPKKIIVAVPVAAASTYEELEPLVDKMICPSKPEDLYAVGMWYEQFNQTDDEEVIELLSQSTLNYKAA